MQLTAKSNAELSLLLTHHTTAYSYYYYLLLGIQGILHLLKEVINKGKKQYHLEISMIFLVTNYRDEHHILPFRSVVLRFSELS